MRVHAGGSVQPGCCPSEASSFLTGEEIGPRNQHSRDASIQSAPHHGIAILVKCSVGQIYADVYEFHWRYLMTFSCLFWYFVCIEPASVDSGSAMDAHTPAAGY